MTTIAEARTAGYTATAAFVVDGECIYYVTGFGTSAYVAESDSDALTSLALSAPQPGPLPGDVIENDDGSFDLVVKNEDPDPALVSPLAEPIPARPAPKPPV